MNAFIYCEFGNLFIRKPNGLEWRHEQVDRPELGFEYEVIIFDDIEVKTIEEPIQGIVILLSSRPERLLNTITSRCQIVPFNAI